MRILALDSSGLVASVAVVEGGVQMCIRDRDINQKITEELGVKRWQVDAAVKLIDEGNTIPFIARYRKEFGKRI